MDIEKEDNKITEGISPACEVETHEITSCSSEKAQQLQEDLPSQIVLGDYQNNISKINYLEQPLDKLQTTLRSKRKYIKKVIQQFQKYTKDSKDTLKPQELQVFPLYQFVQEKFEFLLIGGDYIYKLQTDLEENTNPQQLCYSSSSSIDFNDSERSLNAYKDILCVKRNQTYFTVEMQNKFAGIIDFSQFISAINTTISALSGQSTIENLLEYQKMLCQNHQAIKEIIEFYPNHQDLIQLQKLRLEFFEAAGYKFLKENYQEDDFLLIGTIMASFDKEVPVLNSLSFNKAAVGLIGGDFDFLQQYFLRKGIKEFFDFQTRLLIQSCHISGIIKKSNQLFTAPFTLITYDDIRISCRIEIQTLFLEIPEQLKYKTSKNNQMDVHEGTFTLRIMLSAEQLDEISKIRNEGIFEQHQKSEIHCKEIDVCYNMQSQYLMEKYYAKHLKTISKEPLFAGTVKESEKIVEKEIVQEQDLNGIEKEILNQQTKEVKRCMYRVL